MVKLKYTGKGMLSRSINFDPNRNGGLYDVSEEDAEYFLKYFPNQFVLIEAAKKAPASEKDGDTKPKRTRKPRVKKTDITE